MVFYVYIFFTFSPEVVIVGVLPPFVPIFFSPSFSPKFTKPPIFSPSFSPHFSPQQKTGESSPVKVCYKLGYISGVYGCSVEFIVKQPPNALDEFFAPSSNYNGCAVCFKLALNQGS